MGAVSGATLNEIQLTYFQTFKFKPFFFFFQIFVSFYLNPPNVETWKGKTMECVVRCLWRPVG